MISSGGSNPTLRPGSLVIRRSGDTYQFELDLPSPGGGVRPAIWSGTQRVEPQVWSSLKADLDRTATGLVETAFFDARSTSTQIASNVTVLLEKLGRSMYQNLLPEEVRDDLARFYGSLILASDDSSLPWEMIHDGREFLGITSAIGRRLTATRRRRTGDGRRRPPAESGALLIGDPNSSLEETDREIEALSEILSRQGACRVLKGPRATKPAVLEALQTGEFSIVHFAGPLKIDSNDPQQCGLLLADQRTATIAEIEGAIEGEPFVFFNGPVVDQSAPSFLGPQIEFLASALAACDVRGFIGSYWPAYDAGSRQLAVEFYRRAADGYGAGEALRQARSTVRARRGNEPTWSSYVYYGDPLLTVVSGARAAAESLLLAPKARFGPFVLEQEVGRGGMGVVWKAYQPSLDRYVALKFMPAAIAADATNRERFKREARMVARMRHSNILTVHDFGEESGHLFLVTEFVPGGTFQDVLKHESRLPVVRALQLLGPVAAALDHVHSQGVVHRDVKPSNILLNEDGAPVLADCGVARLLEESSHVTGTGAVVGTPAYMSPEQAAGHEVGPASDQYSLGVVLYETLVGKPPFEARTPVATALAHLQQAPPNPRTLNPDLLPGVEWALLKVLAKKPDERFPNCMALMESLKEAVNAPGRTTAVDFIPPDNRQTLPPAAATQMLGSTVAQRTAVRPSAAAQQYDQAIPAGSAAEAYRRAAPPVAPSRRSGAVLPIVIGAVAVLAAGLYAANQLFAPASVVSPSEPVFNKPPSDQVTPAPPAAALIAPVVPPKVEAPIQPPAVSPVASGPAGVAVPPIPSAPREVAAWQEVLARLDTGLWSNDLAAAAKAIDDYIERFKETAVPESKDKLYAASMELGKQRVAARDFTAARGRFQRAVDLRPNDQVSSGELRKVELYLRGDGAYVKGDWQLAVDSFGELQGIQADYADVAQRLQAAQAELQKTFTPTPVPAQPKPQTQPQTPQPQPQPQPKPQQPPTPKPLTPT